jgi:hypothetical protein
MRLQQLHAVYKSYNFCVLNSALCDEGEVLDTCLTLVGSDGLFSELCTTIEVIDSTHLTRAWMQTGAGLDTVVKRNLSPIAES